MTKEQPTRQDQKTNSQAQAGAASQIILNLIFMTHDGTNWVVQPLMTSQGEGGSESTMPALTSSGGGVSAEGPSTGVEVETQKKSNAQGQGLTVHNVAHMAEELARAMNLATEEWLKRRSEDPEASSS